MERYRDYDPFAWLYAHHWGFEFHCQILGVLDRAVLRLLPAGARILDLCCGDGRVASALSQSGYQVTGVDGSAQMLKYARRNAPGAKFLLRDARKLELPPSFQAVISTFDSLNHVNKRSELHAVFRGVQKALEPGGYFLFDLNEERAYTELWVEMAGLVLPEVVMINESSYDRKRGIATCCVTQFRKTKRNWKRTGFTLTQRHHEHTAVIAGLEKAGFRSIASLSAAEDLAMEGPIGLHRTFYLARK